MKVSAGGASGKIAQKINLKNNNENLNGFQIDEQNPNHLLNELNKMTDKKVRWNNRQMNDIIKCFDFNFVFKLESESKCFKIESIAIATSAEHFRK